MRKEFAYHGHVAQHLTECIHFSPEVTLDRLASILWRLLDNMAVSPESGGRQPNDITKTTVARCGLITLSRIGLSYTSHGYAVNFLPALAHVPFHIPSRMSIHMRR